MKVEFTVLGEPQGKARARTIHFDKNGNRLPKPRSYTPEETTLYENLIITEYRQQTRGYRFPDGEYIDMSVTAYYSIPASVSKKKRELMLTGKIRPVKKPDWDNIGKVVADSLNKIAYVDDSHITDGQIKKYYSDQPRLEITIQTAQ